MFDRVVRTKLHQEMRSPYQQINKQTDKLENRVIPGYMHLTDIGHVSG